MPRVYGLGSLIFVGSKTKGLIRIDAKTVETPIENYYTGQR